MAAIANLIIDQGANFSSDITVKDANGNAFDLTGYTTEAKMAKGYASTRTRTTITSAVASDATTGVVSLTLTATQTAALDAPERYVYDVEISFQDSDDTTIVERILEGRIQVTPSVTK